MAEHDEQLARRSQRGDLNAFAELVRRHRRVVHAIARGVLGSAEEAEDAAQESFVRAYRRIGTYNGRHAFAGWIRRIAANCAVTRLRQRARERRHREALSLANRGTVGPDPADHAAAAEVTRSIREAVGSLPFRQRLAFTLFHLEDMTLAETAQALGCSVNAVKVQLHRARRTLARRLADRLDEE
jgi:RNA polymerase sigma-70 factor (ECF subfamily)